MALHSRLVLPDAALRPHCRLLFPDAVVEASAQRQLLPDAAVRLHCQQRLPDAALRLLCQQRPAQRRPGQQDLPDGALLRRPGQQQLPDGTQPRCPGQQHLSCHGAPASNSFPMALSHGAQASNISAATAPPASNKPHSAERSTPVWLAIWRTWAGFANSQLRRATIRAPNNISAHPPCCHIGRCSDRANLSTHQHRLPTPPPYLRRMRLSPGRGAGVGCWIWL